VPVLAAAGGTLLLDEPVTLRLALASAVILGGIALVVLTRRDAAWPHVNKK
jgi:drug/metabolite transporter (DMT)-like permease